MLPGDAAAAVVRVGSSQRPGYTCEETQVSGTLDPWGGEAGRFMVTQAAVTALAPTPRASSRPPLVEPESIRPAG